MSGVLPNSAGGLISENPSVFSDDIEILGIDVSSLFNFTEWRAILTIRDDGIGSGGG